MKIKVSKALLIGLPVWTVQSFTYLTLWGFGFAMGDSGATEYPQWLSWSLSILGTPLMWAVMPFFELFAPHGRWWGDDSNLLIGFAIANGLVWAASVVAAFAFFARKKGDPSLGSFK